MTFPPVPGWHLFRYDHVPGLRAGQLEATDLKQGVRGRGPGAPPRHADRWGLANAPGPLAHVLGQPPAAPRAGGCGASVARRDAAAEGARALRQSPTRLFATARRCLRRKPLSPGPALGAEFWELQLTGDTAATPLAHRADDAQDALCGRCLCWRRCRCRRSPCYCQPFLGALADFARLAEEFQGRARFAVVYLEEAHPTDGWMYGEPRETARGGVRPYWARGEMLGSKGPARTSENQVARCAARRQGPRR